MKLEVTDKFSRQFKLFYLFFHFRVLEYMDLNWHIKVSLKTTQRDVKDLTDAGLINVYFSKRENGYTWHDWEDREDMIYTMCCLPPPRLGQNQARNRHLKKLNRFEPKLFIENTLKAPVCTGGTLEYVYYRAIEPEENYWCGYCEYETGKVTIQPIYQNANYFVHETAEVKKNGKYGYIDPLRQ